MSVDNAARALDAILDMTVLGTYEMLWDCPACGTRGLLGRTNRHCPNCGAAQDPEKRYFPEEGKETAVANYTFEGTDRSCPYCATPNGAKATHCKNCGGPLDGSAEVQKIVDETSAPPAPPLPAPPKESKPFARKLLVVLGLIVITLFVAICWKKDVRVRIAAHRWNRQIQIESFAQLSDSSWCDNMPSDAYGVRRSREQRSTRSIADGEDCSTSNRDNGDGTFSRVRDCHTRYREEPVYDTKCYYSVNRWQQSRQVTAEGASVIPEPSWPETHLRQTGQCLGCEREGTRSEHYLLDLRNSEDSYSCEVDATLWRRYHEGDELPMKVRVIGGGADCSSLAQR